MSRNYKFYNPEGDRATRYNRAAARAEESTQFTIGFLVGTATEVAPLLFNSETPSDMPDTDLSSFDAGAKVGSTSTTITINLLK